MMEFIRYNTTTGAIRSVGTCQTSQFALQARPGYSVIEGNADAQTEYIDVATQTVSPRPVGTATLDKVAMSADGVEEVELTGVEPGDSVYVVLEGEIIDTFRHSVENSKLTFDLPGAFVIRVVPTVKLPSEVMVNAT